VEKTTQVLKLEQDLKAAKYALAAKESRDNLLAYMRFIHPHPDDPDDIEKSTYQITPQAKLLCQIVEKVVRGEMNRVAVSISPQTGKSEIISRGGPAWASGLDPRRHIMLGSYNQPLADEFGSDVRHIVTHPRHKLVFPEYGTRKEATNLIITEEGGKLAFVGVGGSGTGKPADLFVVDDPIKGDEDAQSPVFRERVWRWFNRVAMTRCTGQAGIIIVHTRWHEDDLIGRLCDPDHPERNKKYAGIADKWTYINIPAVISDPKLADAMGITLEPQEDRLVVQEFGRKPIASIWPQRFPLHFLAETKRMDPQGFSALRMGRPTPDEGIYFKAEDIEEAAYDSVHQIPTNLRKYAASDHAVSEKQRADYTVIGTVGVDENDDIWVLPDLIWERIDTYEVVEAMLDKMKDHDPLLWWMEADVISKAFGPFLRKRMSERRIYTAIDPCIVAKDKPTRARAIQGRIQQRKVKLPRFAPWYTDAKAQMMRFPAGTNDDFVDFLAHIGHGLQKEIKPRKDVPREDGPRVGSMEWILQRAHRDALRKRTQKAVGW
jgi:predicted phage terminase large subunit-like protein